eukprot:1759576-Rhodomonas_salina.2
MRHISFVENPERLMLLNIQPSQRQRDEERAEARMKYETLNSSADSKPLGRVQFKLLQTTMRTDSAANFQVWTTTSMDTYWDGQLIEPRQDLDPCASQPVSECLVLRCNTHSEKEKGKHSSARMQKHPRDPRFAPR